MIYRNNIAPVASYIEENAILLEGEGESLKFVANDAIPEDFKKCIIKLMEDIEKETGKRVGSGSTDAAFGSIKISVSNAKERIRKGKIKNSYSIIVPYKVLKNAPDKNISGDDFITKVVKSNGFTKGGKLAGAWQGYYYKNGKNAIYALGWMHGIGQIQIHILCVENSKENLKFIKSNHAMNESASSEDDLGHDKEELTPNDTGFEGISIEDYLGYNPDELGLARCEELKEDPAYGDFFRNPIVMETFTMHMDLNDSLTRKAVLAMNEAEQASVLTALTSKLYDHIVAKVDDIDYGEIPSTKGDVTKLSNYSKLRECINLLRDILKEYKQDTGPIDEIGLALVNIETRKDLFTRAFKLNVELPIIMYNNVVLSVINAVSYMIATSIEFIKTPNHDGFQITLDKVAYAKTKSNLLYNNLKRFNKCCQDKDFDKSMEHIIEEYVNMHEGAAIGAAVKVAGAKLAGLGTTAKTIGGLMMGTIGGKVILVTGIILMIIPLLREMVFMFYYTRMRVSEFFDIQADLLQMNAYNVENNNTMDNARKEKIISSQMKIVDFFRKMANKISINNRKAEVNATRDIEASDKKMKIGDISDELPDSVSVLF